MPAPQAYRPGMPAQPPTDGAEADGAPPPGLYGLAPQHYGHMPPHAPGPGGASPFDAQSPGRVEPQRPDLNVHSDASRYFVITSNTKENVVKSIRHGLWATQRKNEQRLDEAFRTAPAVLLVFSVNRSDAFQGYARMRSSIGKPRSRTVDPFNGFGRLFDLEWLRLHDLPYREVDTLRNPLAADDPVRKSRDGQELSNLVGRRLCGLIDRHIDRPESFPPPQAPPPAPSSGWQPPPMQPPAGPPPDEDEGEQGRQKRRKKERKYRNAPHPLESAFDAQLEFFLGLDYDDYVQWHRRLGASSPGPTPPPGMEAVGGPPPAAAPPPPPGGGPPPPPPPPPPPGAHAAWMPHGGHFPPPPGHPPPPPHMCAGGHGPWHPPPVHMGHPPPHMGHHPPPHYGHPPPPHHYGRWP